MEQDFPNEFVEKVMWRDVIGWQLTIDQTNLFRKTSLKLVNLVQSERLGSISFISCPGIHDTVYFLFFYHSIGTTL